MVCIGILHCNQKNKDAKCIKAVSTATCSNMNSGPVPLCPFMMRGFLMPLAFTAAIPSFQVTERGNHNPLVTHNWVEGGDVAVLKVLTAKQEGYTTGSPSGSH